MTHSVVTVESGEVGSGLTLAVTSKWNTYPAGSNMQAGVVTDVPIAAGQEVTQGTTLYSVDLRPVVVAQGAVPAFRDIAEGSEGADVSQLQSMLSARGHYKSKPDGIASSETTKAVRAWQRSMNAAETGIVSRADVVFVPTLPARILLDNSRVSRGQVLSGGEPVISTLAAEPTFDLPVTEAQFRMIPQGSSVEIASPTGSVWSGKTAESRRDDQTQGVIIAVIGIDGRAVCADTCGEIPAEANTQLSANVVTVPSLAGAVVPSSALVATSDGRTWVLDELGEKLPVSVIRSARGLSVIDGVAVGTRIRVPGSLEG